MDTIVVGIDVSKDKLDIAVRPSGEVFGTSRDAAGLDALIARLAPLSPAAVAVEATVASRPWWRQASRRQGFLSLW